MKNNRVSIEQYSIDEKTVAIFSYDDGYKAHCLYSDYHILNKFCKKIIPWNKLTIDQQVAIATKAIRDGCKTLVVFPSTCSYTTIPLPTYNF